MDPIHWQETSTLGDTVRRAVPVPVCPKTQSLTNIAETAAVVVGRRLFCGLPAPLLAGGMDPSQIQEAHYFLQRCMHAWFKYQPPSLSLSILHTLGIVAMLTTLMSVYICVSICPLHACLYIYMYRVGSHIYLSVNTFQHLCCVCIFVLFMYLLDANMRTDFVCELSASWWIGV